MLITGPHPFLRPLLSIQMCAPLSMRASHTSKPATALGTRNLRVVVGGESLASCPAVRWGSVSRPTHNHERRRQIIKVTKARISVARVTQIEHLPSPFIIIFCCHRRCDTIFKPGSYGDYIFRGLLPRLGFLGVACCVAVDFECCSLSREPGLLYPFKT